MGINSSAVCASAIFLFRLGPCVFAWRQVLYLRPTSPSLSLHCQGLPSFIPTPDRVHIVGPHPWGFASVASNGPRRCCCVGLHVENHSVSYASSSCVRWNATRTLCLLPFPGFTSETCLWAFLPESPPSVRRSHSSAYPSAFTSSKQVLFSFFCINLGLAQAPPPQW